MWRLFWMYFTITIFSYHSLRPLLAVVEYSSSPRIPPPPIYHLHYYCIPCILSPEAELGLPCGDDYLFWRTGWSWWHAWVWVCSKTLTKFGHNVNWDAPLPNRMGNRRAIIVVTFIPAMILKGGYFSNFCILPLSTWFFLTIAKVSSTFLKLFTLEELDE